MAVSGVASTFSEASRLVDAALAMTEQRLAGAAGGGGMLGSIQNQLRFMQAAVAAGRTPTIAEKNSLSAGVIAVREFETNDPEYCDALCAAVFAFKKL